MKHYRKLLSLLLIICISMTMLTGYIPVNAVTPTPEPPLESITPFELPDIVDAAEAEEKGYVGRVKTEEKDLYTFVFANGDGTNTMRVYGHPVKYVAKDGTIRDISLDVKAKADGGFVTTDHEIITTFEKTLTNGVSLTYNDVEVTLVPKLGLGKSPTATLDSNNKMVTYKMNDVTSFVYELTYAGFKEDIVVKEYTGQTEYEFTLFTNGLTLCEEYGSYHLADAEGNVEATIGDIIVFTADERNNTMGSMTYETVRANQEYVLTIHLDADYLADEDTVYPIRIDPTIEINYDNNGAGAIEDITINSLQGSDGSSRSLFVGRRETYGLSRVLMKFPNLSLDGIYSGSIISASVELRDLICQGDEDITVECRIYNKNAPAWTEDETTSWQSVGTSYVGSLLDSHVISYGEGNVAGEQHRYSFNILNAVIAWAIGTEDPNKGLVFKANESFENQTGDDIKTWHKTFAAYNRSDYRPSLSIKYSTIFSLDYSVISIPEGESRILGANTNPSGQTVTWTTSNSTIATVSTSGVVTAKKAGTVTITASMIDADNVQHFATCTVYVYIPNGVYYIQNLNSNYYLHVENGGIANLTNVCQHSKYSDSKRNDHRIRQMWKTYYLGDGRYSIRPMNKLDKGLDVTSGNVDIYTIGTSDALESVPYYGEWTISWYSTGYVFKNNGDDSKTMQIENSSTLSGANVVVSAYSTSKNCRWGLTKVSSPPAGAYLYDTAKESIVSTATRDIYVGSTNNLSTLQLCAVAYSGTRISQSFTWSSSNNAIATVDSNGAVTGVSSGKATISGQVYRDGEYHRVNYTIYAGVSFETTMSKLDELYDMALEYASAPHDAALLTMQFIRRLRYNGESWTTVAGAVESQFVDYVETNDPSLYDFFTIEYTEDYYYLDPNGEGYVDFRHLCATMNGLLYDSEGFKAAVAGEANIDNLCGWAGDLQTLCVDVLNYTNNSNDYDIVYNATYDMIGDAAYSLSMMDLLADTDAYNIYRLLNSSSSNFISAFTTYYDDYVGTRYTQFTNEWSKQTIYDCVRNYTTNTFFLWKDWPLLAGYDISNTQANAIASAFTDFIWEKIQDE